MKLVTTEDLKRLYIPLKNSHKGQNGRLLIIGGSHLFHAASLWALTVASRIVDLVHYSSVPENNEIVQKAKEEFRNGIVVRRGDLESYIEEDDCILIGPGMERNDNVTIQQINKLTVRSIKDLEQIDDEGLYTAALTNYLLAKYPQKQWVIDAGALQMMDISLIPKNAILTPHHGEFDRAFGAEIALRFAAHPSSPSLVSPSFTPKEDMTVLETAKLTAPMDVVQFIAKTHHCIVLLKGEKDVACSPEGECRMITGGNAGMTKGGTGDVLAGLIASLACKNDPFLATVAGSFINKKAGDALYETVGPYFNATDLAEEIPVVMRRLLMST